MGNLPRFASPPVVEVTAGVQFDKIDWLLAPRLGLIWQEFSSNFPLIEQHPPLPPVRERLGIRQSVGDQFKLAIDKGGGTPRLWMLSANELELIQIQPDRFHRNWRKYGQEHEQYPHYDPHIRPKFFEAFRTFCQFLKRNGLSIPKVNQCEVTYVNHIYPNDQWSTHADLGQIFRGWSSGFYESWVELFENATVSFRKLIYDEAGDFAGRLHVQIEPGFTRSNSEDASETEIYVLTLTARGRPTADGEEGIKGFFDLGHIEIVNTFDQITTEQMHDFWKKEES